MGEVLICDKILENVQSSAVSGGLREQLQGVEGAILIVKDFLGGIGSRKIRSNILRLISDSLCDLDDHLEKLKVFSNSGNQVMNKGCFFFSPIKDYAVGVKMGRLIDKSSQNLVSIVSECSRIEDQIFPNEVPLLDTPRSESRSFVYQRDIIGRDEDRQKLVDRLLDSDDKVDVIPIVGVVGVGKTALAQLVFNDERVVIQFELRTWFSASNNPSFEQTIRAIISQTGHGPVDPSLSTEYLSRILLQEIHGKLFLLVLDDLREGFSPKWWFDLSYVLNIGARGSKILVTTQSWHVGELVGYTQPYTLQGLSEDYSWSLFEKVAFGQEKPGSKLLETGKEIVKHCGNIPLVIKLTGSLLYGSDERKWLSVLEQIRRLWSPGLFTQGLMRIFVASYNELSIDLKACLSYCSLFPADYELNKHDLISLWMAQGYIDPKHPNQNSQIVGEDYFMELLRRGFFQDVKKGQLGDILTCKKSNMCDLAAHVTRFGSTVSESDLDIFGFGVYHVSFNYERGSMWRIPNSLFQAQKLRTFLWTKERADSSTQPTRYNTCNRLVSNFRSLRVLDLHDFGFENLPGSISELFHLRYLDLSNNDLVELPESITRLYYLQTLKLNFCEKLRRLPNGMGKLINLKRLEIDECDSLTGIPLELGVLRHLQTLSRLIVGKAGSDPKRNGGLRVLNGLNSLRGRLTIELYKEWTSFLKDAQEAELSSKHELSELKIDWGLENPHHVSPSHYQEFLERFQPYRNLKLLCIIGYRGSGFPGWFNLLPHLVVLSIDGSYQCQSLPSFHHLRFLSRLTLRFMDGVEYVESISSPPSEPFFQSLEELTLHSFNNLKGWWKEEEVLPMFPSLVKLKIWNCPKLMCMPLFSHVEDLDLLNINQQLIQDSRLSSEATVHATSSTGLNSLSRSSSSAISFQNLPYLKRLRIKGCHNLGSFPPLAMSEESSGVSSLKYLVVDGCDELRSLAEGLQHLSSLEQLEISSCRELDFSSESQEDNDMPWKNLSQLRYLTFHDIPKLEKLPDGLQRVSTLRFLCISSCNGLVSLPEWMSRLTSLVHLRIECCQTLTKLPNVLKDLHSLVKVEITECPVLVERCKEHTGEDWHKIKHARVLLHKSWRYGLLSDVAHSQPRQQNHKTATKGIPVTVVCPCHCHCQQSQCK